MITLHIINSPSIQLLNAASGAETTSTLKLSGSTGSEIKFPSLPSATFDPLSLNASMVVQPSVSLEFLDLEGGASVEGIGSFNVSFSYAKDATTLELELKPFTLPPPFVSKETSVTLSADIGTDTQTLSGTFSAQLQLEKSGDPVTINVEVVLDRSTQGNQSSYGMVLHLHI